MSCVSLPSPHEDDDICEDCEILYKISKTPRIPNAPNNRIGLAMAMMAAPSGRFKPSRGLEI